MLETSSGAALPWRCGEPLPPPDYARLLRRAIFDCCKWHTQVEDRPVLCAFPLVLDADRWDEVAHLAERLATETLAAERELLERGDLHERLGLPRALRRGLRRIGTAGPAGEGPRVMRFDFHWTAGGWRISEANTDVAGGFIEASGVTRLVAECYPGCLATGDPAGVLSAAMRRRVGAGGRVGLMHLTVYVEDRQVMLYLARRLEECGVRPCLFSPAQQRWRAGGAEAACDWYAGPLGLVLRFFPCEWLPQLPRATAWEHFFAGGRTPVCNPGYAVLTQSKRFPLVWDRLATPLPTWRSLLPETRPPRAVSDLESGGWVLKPALGHEGRDIGIGDVTEPDAWQHIARAVRRHPEAWAAQRRFQSVPLPTPEGVLYPCLGVYVIDGRAAGCYGRMGLRPLIDDRSREAAVLVRSAESGSRDEYREISDHAARSDL
jgi:glutathionylspermidine synthase